MRTLWFSQNRGRVNSLLCVKAQQPPSAPNILQYIKGPVMQLKLIKLSSYQKHPTSKSPRMCSHICNHATPSNSTVLITTLMGKLFRRTPNSMSEKKITQTALSTKQPSKFSDNIFNTIVRYNDHKLTYWYIFDNFHLPLVKTRK